VRLHHGAALYEANQFAQARVVFESLIKDYRDRRGSRGGVIFGASVCARRVSKRLTKRISLGNQKPNYPEASGRVNQIRQTSLYAQAVKFFEDQAEESAKKLPNSEIQARLLYQAIWGNRSFAESDVNEARAKMQEEAQRQREATKKTVEGPQAVEASALRFPFNRPRKKSWSFTGGSWRRFLIFPWLFTLDLNLRSCLMNAATQHRPFKILKEALDKEPPADWRTACVYGLGLATRPWETANRLLTTSKSWQATPKVRLSPRVMLVLLIVSCARRMGRSRQALVVFSATRSLFRISAMSAIGHFCV